ncbi:rac GTPase-activating protein 1 [Cephus cinctus]|uniref:Rac GTPase-activating protein 1 n=1 Tax=Cephus cinctus TaxID=211228 RepID=A0AAJ7C9L1_CEPCN|nr:rac GTPase-activating protein 1 [Cephus cinctus]
MTDQPWALSMVASYDELTRCTNVLACGSCEEEFLRFAINQEEMRQKMLASVQECQRLHSALEKAHIEAADLDRKLSHARRLLDEEKKRRRIVEDQRNSLERQIALARDLLFNDGGRNLNDETREKLQFLNNTTLNARNSNVYLKEMQHNDKLNTIAELDSTGSLLSDLSCFSKSEDDLDASAIIQHSQKKREWKEHRPSGEYSAKKRRSNVQKVAELNSSDRIVATTTVVMPKDGTITASSVIEAVPSNENQDPQTQLRSARKRRKSGERHSRTKIPPLNLDDPPMDTAPSAPKAEIMTSGSDSEGIFKPSPNIGGYTLNSKTSRGHSFTAKTVIKPEMCIPCGKRIRFGKVALKCRDCRATTHSECKDLVPLPCVPAGNTPTLRGVSGTIADYTPMIPPMVPSLVVHCINEVELRGMGEQGLYRVNGGSLEVKCLKEKFLKGKGAPNLSDVDIPTICSTLKDFLRTLREPLLTVGLWADFARATTIADKQDADAALYQAISELPQPNRDTLAFLILHLQRVSSTPECKMPISNLAKVFGPTLVGYSSQEPSPTSMLTETKNQVAIVESLLKIPSDYWANFVNTENLHQIGTPKTSELRHTPSTESLLKRTASRGIFHTPISASRTFMKRNKKYFATPPTKTGF